MKRVMFRNEEYVYIPVPAEETSTPTVKDPALLALPQYYDPDTGDLNDRYHIERFLGRLPDNATYAVGNDEIRAFGQKVASRDELQFLPDADAAA